MQKNAVSGLLSTLLLLVLMMLAFNIQPANSDWIWTETIYIRADGSIEPDTAPISTVDNITYTLTDNIVGDVPEWARAICVERDNIVVDGAGYTVQGTEARNSVGIVMWGRSNVTIKNVGVTDFYRGIYFVYSSNNTLTGGTTSNNFFGIYLYASSNNTLTGNTALNSERSGISLDISGNNVLTGNNASNNDDGMYIWDSGNNILSGNTASLNNRYGIWVRRPGNNVLTHNTASNNKYGIFFEFSSNNTLTDNTASNNEYNFGVEGYKLSDFINDVDTSNTVDGKPIYYLIEEADDIIDTQTNAGTVYAINCNNITMRNLALTENEYGVLFWNTANSKIENVTVSNNGYGIYLRGSSKNIFFHNNFINNTKYGSVQQVSSYSSTNTWDDGYPSGGNYWSDHVTVDECCGVNQDETGSDGIVDEPYIIDADNRDHYPLVEPWSPAIPATIDIAPDTLHLMSQDQWITCYIELPEGYNVSDIDVSTVMLNDTIPVSLLDVPAPDPVPTEIGDYDNDTIPDLMVKFDRATVSELILSQRITDDVVTLAITGEVNGTPFKGTDTIRVLMGGGGGAGARAKVIA